MSDATKNILRQANAAVEQGDHAGFIEHCTENTVWTFLGDRTLQGKAAVRQWMDESYKVAPPQLKGHRLVVEGDVLTAVGEIVLTAAAGKKTHYAYCDVWRLRDGKLATLHAFVVETEEELSGLASERP